MTIAKFTPGPWVNEGCNIRSAATNTGIAIVGTTWGDGALSHDQNVANAVLIGAAPELYGALRECVFQFGLLEEAGMLGTADVEALSAARSALAKAEGGNGGTR